MNDSYKNKLLHTFSMNVEAILKKYSLIKYAKHLYLSENERTFVTYIVLALKVEYLFIHTCAFSIFVKVIHKDR